MWMPSELISRDYGRNLGGLVLPQIRSKRCMDWAIGSNPWHLWLTRWQSPSGRKSSQINQRLNQFNNKSSMLYQNSKKSIEQRTN